MIRVIRDRQVMLDSDLSVLYGVETRRLNEQVKRNIERFPCDFMFQLTKEELDNLMSQFATSSWGGTRKLPYDNYVDDTVLALLDKRAEGVTATIYTQRVNSQLQLDVDRHNVQYPFVEIKRFNKAHDRFLLIDDEVFHIGASIKDLGKKWFGFTLMRDITATELIDKIKG